MEDNKNFWWNVELSVPISQSNRASNEERLSTIAAITNSIGSEIFTEKDAEGRARLFGMSCRRYMQNTAFLQRMSLILFLRGFPEHSAYSA